MSRVGQAVLIKNAEESRNKGAELPASVFFFLVKVNESGPHLLAISYKQLSWSWLAWSFAGAVPC